MLGRLVNRASGRLLVLGLDVRVWSLSVGLGDSGGTSGDELKDVHTTTTTTTTERERVVPQQKKNPQTRTQEMRVYKRSCAIALCRLGVML